MDTHETGLKLIANLKLAEKILESRLGHPVSHGSQEITDPELLEFIGDPLTMTNEQVLNNQQKLIVVRERIIGMQRNLILSSGIIEKTEWECKPCFDYRLVLTPVLFPSNVEFSRLVGEEQIPEGWILTLTPGACLTKSAEFSIVIDGHHDDPMSWMPPIRKLRLRLVTAGIAAAARKTEAYIKELQKFEKAFKSRARVKMDELIAKRNAFEAEITKVKLDSYRIMSEIRLTAKDVVLEENMLRSVMWKISVVLGCDVILAKHTVCPAISGLQKLIVKLVSEEEEENRSGYIQLDKDVYISIFTPRFIKSESDDSEGNSKQQITISFRNMTLKQVISYLDGLGVKCEEEQNEKTE